MHPRSKDLGERVANGHATKEHLPEFADLGIHTNEQLNNHIATITDSKETICFTSFSTEQSWRQADIFYHEPSNTMVIDPLNPQNEPTTYRPDEGRKRFDEKLRDAESIEDRTIGISLGMSELYPDKENFKKNDSKSLRTKEFLNIEKIKENIENKRNKTVNPQIDHDHDK